jgi:hypothetical protein
MATSNQDFSGLLGDIFGGGSISGLEDYLTPAQTEQMNRQALLQAAIAATQASAPSTSPRSFMQILGAGLGGGQQGYAQAQEGAMKQLLTRQKLDEYKRQKALEAAAQKIIIGDGVAAPETLMTPEQAISAPVSAEMPAGPTMQRAELIGQKVVGEPLSQADAMYNRYMRLSELFAASAPEKAKAYQELAKTIKPTLEVVGEPYRTADGKFYQRTKTGGRIEVPAAEAPIPEVVGEPYRSSDGKFYQRTKTGGRIEVPAAEAPAAKPIGNMEQVTDAAGKLVLAQRYDDGSIKTVEGFGVPRDLVQVNLGGEIKFVDKNSIPANATYLTGLTPAQAAQLKLDQANLNIALKRLNLSQQEFARGQYDRVETADGFAYVPKTPGMPIIPIMGSGGEQLAGKGNFTEDQGKSAGFALRMNESTKLFKAPVLDPMTNKPLVVGGKQITLEDAFGQPSRYQSIMRSIPSAGLTTGIANFSETSGRQQYRQAQENWVTANLRAESGAVIGTDEMEKEIKKYFPQVDDKPQVIEQKAKARKSAELAMEVRGGPALKTIKKAQQGQNTDGGLTWNPITKKFE